jgi:alanine-synthesizing transaminase
MFSGRVPRSLAPNRVSTSIAAHRASGRPLIDLTVSNPTIVGIHYDTDLLAPLASAAALTYGPEPFGMRSARRAVAADYARRGISVAEDRIVLTASTSEAYSILFKLLCAPAGDEVLVPRPSYPLFDHLTELDGVGCNPYVLEYHGRWMLDEASVDDAWTAKTRAVLAVSPNNPTGSVLSPAERTALTERCAAREAALIVDEVFADYPFEELPEGSGSGGAGNVGGPGAHRPQTMEALTFRLGGLSKSAGLPQVKLGWVAVDGPDALVRSALERLEWICDAYLSAATPVQVAAPRLIENGAKIRSQILSRVRTNLGVLRAMAGSHPAVELLNGDGGWSAVIRVPSREPEEDLVLALLEQRDTLVHPGYFFDFPHEAFVVLSLLPAPEQFADGVARILEHVDG